MSIKIASKQDQARGSFAGGLILENKPIGFPQDGGGQKPFSNLFYWAHAWSDHGGLIGEHPHKMFEIMSFVLDGGVEHYDSKFKRWLPLKKGDVQIIRSGSGITHAEKLLENSRIFQIWFDPNVEVSLTEEATYDDYKAEDMKYDGDDPLAIKNYVGNNGPIKMNSEGVEIKEYKLMPGTHHIQLDNSKTNTYYVLSGHTYLGEEELREHDFIVVENESKIKLVVQAETKIFNISVPQKLTYKTYLEHVNN